MHFCMILSVCLLQNCKLFFVRFTSPLTLDCICRGRPLWVSFSLSRYPGASSASSLQCWLLLFKILCLSSLTFGFLKIYFFLINISFHSLFFTSIHVTYIFFIGPTDRLLWYFRNYGKVYKNCAYLLLPPFLCFGRIAEALYQITKLGNCSSALLPGCFQHSLSSWRLLYHTLSTASKFKFLLSSFVVSFLGYPFNTSGLKMLRKLILLAGLGSLFCRRDVPVFYHNFKCAACPMCVHVYILN